MKGRNLYILLILLFPVTQALGQQNKVNRIWSSIIRQYNIFTVNYLVGVLDFKELNISYERTVHRPVKRLGINIQENWIYIR